MSREGNALLNGIRQVGPAIYIDNLVACMLDLVIHGGETKVLQNVDCKRKGQEARRRING